MEISKTEIGNALTSADENHILATTNDIYDETQQAYQSDINKSLTEGKQDKLVSGTNIKTINGTSLLGEGDVTISGGSGGGDFDSSGTYPNLTAGKATKLATARTISLSEGVTSTATAFDGSGNIDIPVTSVYDSYLKWGGKLIPNGMSPLDAASPIFSANRVAFFPTDKMMVEYTNDGGVTWLDYGADDLNKTIFTNYELGNAIFRVGKKDADITPSDMVKVTFDFDGTGRYFFLDKILLRVSYVPSPSTKVYIDIVTETYATDTAESIVKTYTYKYIAGYGGWNSIPIPRILVGSSRRNDCARKFSIVLKAENNLALSPSLTCVYFIANTDHSSFTGYFRAGHIYTYDTLQNVTFPAKVTAPSANITNIEATDINSTGKISGANGKATGLRSVALGDYCTAEGYYTTAIGYQAKAKGYYTKAIGTSVEASSNYQTVIGKNNATSTHAFVIGWGTADAKKNIFSVDTSGYVYGTKFITKGGTNQQVVLGDGSLKALSEISPITDADADILLDNHIHGIDIKASGDDVNINIIESTKNGNAWETTEKNLTIPVATQDTAGVISAADKQKIDAIDYEDNTLFVGDGTNGMLSIGYDSSKASADMRVFRDKYSTIHVTSYNDTTGGSIAVMESNGGKGTVEVNGDQRAELVLSGAGQVRATLTKKNEDGTAVKTVIDAEEGITAPKLATIGGTSEQILLGDGTLITFDELKAKLGLI